MRLNYLANAIGLILLYISLVILSPILVALFYQDFSSILPFITASFISAAIGFSLRKFVKNAHTIENLNDIKKSEGLFIVFVSWLVFCLISSIPYLFYGIAPLNAMFEATSGITTTGATILTNYNYPHAFFFWRSFTQWLGGLGIIVLFIAILPQFAVAGRQLFFAEAPGPTEDKITPRIKNTASALWKIYFVLTVIQIVLLILAGMPGFDALCHSLSTLSAGGLSLKEASIMAYNSNIISWIMIIFMFLGGTSFILQYLVITKKNPLLFFKNEEFRAYFKLTFIFSLLISILLIISNNKSIADGITSGFFQVVSITTSTGFANEDFMGWSLTPKLLLFVAMFVGASASSAGGGIKMTRWLILFKSMKSELIKILHPSAVKNIKLDDRNISDEIIKQITVFVFFYFLIFAISAVIISILEQNYTIGLTGAITSLGNIGPAFGEYTGPMGNLANLNPLTKLIMITNMIVGRLELIPFLVLFQRDFWSIKEN